MKRNPSIELYRCLLMLGVCILHACIEPGYCRAWFVNCCCFCVDGFVFITGFFGCRFRVSKVLRLYGVGLVCALVCSVGQLWGSLTLGQVWARAWGIFGGYWFLHAYVVMMVLAPLVDIAIERGRGVLGVLAPVLLMIFGFGWAPVAPFLRDLRLPVTSGLEPYSGITLFGVYICGRLYRHFRLDERIPVRWAVIVGIGALVLNAAGLCEYNSPVNVLLAGCGFHVFLHLPMSGEARTPPLRGWGARAVMLMAPSMFAVYLLHQPNLGLECEFVKAHVDAGWNIYLCYLIAGGAAFGAAVVCDVPRRLCGALLRRPLEAICDKVDAGAVTRDA